MNASVTRIFNQMSMWFTCMRTQIILNIVRKHIKKHIIKLSKMGFFGHQVLEKKRKKILVEQRATKALLQYHDI